MIASMKNNKQTRDSFQIIITHITGSLTMVIRSQSISMRRKKLIEEYFILSRRFAKVVQFLYEFARFCPNKHSQFGRKIVINEKQGQKNTKNCF